MNKQEKKIIQQLRDLVANPPPQVRNTKWFWSLQDLMAKFDVEVESSVVTPATVKDHLAEPEEISLNRALDEEKTLPPQEDTEK